jgi:hypothetical protein
MMKHAKYGVAYVNGFLKNRMSLHVLADGKRCAKTLSHQSVQYLRQNGDEAGRLITV